MRQLPGRSGLAPPAGGWPPPRVETDADGLITALFIFGLRIVPGSDVSVRYQMANGEKNCEHDVPGIARVRAIEQRDDGISLEVSWYYRPEETSKGRLKTHWNEELWEPYTEHVDVVEAESICNVFCVWRSKEEFEANGGPDDFFVSGTFYNKRMKG